MSNPPTATERGEPWLRELLVRSLRNQGLGRLCKGEPSTWDEFSTRSSIALMTGFTLGVVFMFSDWANASTGGTLGIAAAFLVALAAIGAVIGSTRAAIVLFLTWFFAAAAQVVKSDHDVWATVGVPLVITIAAVAALQTRRLATVGRSAPLVLPVALTVLVIPLFTADMWSTVHRLTTMNLVLLAALTLLPLLFAVERQLRTRVEAALVGAAAEAAPGDALDDMQANLTRLLPDDERDRGREDIARLLPAVWEPFNPADRVTQLIHPLRNLLKRNLVIAALGVTTVATLYMGALTWILIPIATARDWTAASVDIQKVGALGVYIDVPLGPYITVSLVLGLLATAVLLASVAVDDDYAEQLADALLRQPARAALGAAVPYLHMRDAAPPSKGSTQEQA